MCHEADQSAFLHTQLYLRILILSYLQRFLHGTNSLSVLMCRKAVNQSIFIVIIIVVVIVLVVVLVRVLVLVFGPRR